MLLIGIAAIVAIALVFVLMGRDSGPDADAKLPAKPLEKLPTPAADVPAPAPAAARATVGAKSEPPASASPAAAPAQPEPRAMSIRPPGAHASDPPPAGGDLAPEPLRESAQVHASGRHAVPHDDEVSVDIRDDEEDEPTGPIPLILVTAVGRTDAGKRRKHNEDSYVSLPEHNVFVIADGMGGYAAGEVASQMAVDTIARAFNTKTFDGEPNQLRPRRGDELVRSIEMANKAILTAARADETKTGMGTTLVSARFSLIRQRVYIAHVGDSRIYRLRGTEYKQLTVDHTLGSLGITGPTAAKLTRAVGIQDEVEVDLITESAEPGDQYVICSDGLSKMLSDETMKRIVSEQGDLEVTCQALVNTANDAGGRDNVTVILIRVERPIPKPAQA